LNIKQHIPNSLTLVNLFCGSLAIVLAVKGRLDLVPFFLAISLLADFLDGLVARALKVSSAIGKELDSLADMVSFGLLPGIILFLFVERPWDAPINILVNILPFTVTLFSALRLAKFNIDETQSEEFRGLATPASTTLVAGLLLANLYQDFAVGTPLVLALSVILPVLLVSNLPMMSFKIKGFSWQAAKWHYIFLATALLLLIIFKFIGLALAVVAYVFINLVRKLATKS
jgi:CDP-diacylglycerol---serine O-phosphatidyltransferase